MRKIVGSGVAMLLLCGAALPVWADDEDDVAAAMNTWGEYLAKGTSEEPGEILTLYADDAVLWGTISTTRRDDPAAIRDYFVNAYKALPGLTVDVRGPQHPRLWRRHCEQHWLLHFLLREGWHDQESAGALQLHPGEARRRVADRRSSLVRHAQATSVNDLQRRDRVTANASKRRHIECPRAHPVPVTDLHAHRGVWSRWVGLSPLRGSSRLRAACPAAQRRSEWRRGRTHVRNRLASLRSGGRLRGRRPRLRADHAPPGPGRGRRLGAHAGDRRRHPGRRHGLSEPAVHDHRRSRRGGVHRALDLPGLSRRLRLPARRRAFGLGRLHRHDRIGAGERAHRRGRAARTRPRAGRGVSRRRHHGAPGGGARPARSVRLLRHPAAVRPGDPRRCSRGWSACRSAPR